MTHPNPSILGNHGDLWANIPAEMRARPQWCYATLKADGNGKIDKAPRDPKTWVVAEPVLAEPTDPTQWGTFEQACAHALARGGLPGFCLRADDPFVCIDLDPETGGVQRPQDELDRLSFILNTFGQSYTEVSRSGKGVHIWLADERPLDWGGFRRDAVEVYRAERFIICTGNVASYGVRPLYSFDWMLDELVSRMEPLDRAVLEPCDAAIRSDDEALERLFSQVGKFDLPHESKGQRYRRWHTYGPAQGENWSSCDLDYLTSALFATEGNWEQALRLFERSALWRGEGSVNKKNGHERPEKYLNSYLLKHTMPKALGKWRAWKAERDRKNAIITSHGAGLIRNIRF